MKRLFAESGGGRNVALMHWQNIEDNETIGDSGELFLWQYVCDLFASMASTLIFRSLR